MFNGFDLSTISAIYVGNTPYSAIYYGSTKIWPTVVDYLTIPLTFEILGSSYTGTMLWKASNASISKTIEYRKNNGSWTSITSSTSGASISISTGDKIQFRGDNGAYSNGTYYNFFSVDVACEVNGNIMSMISSTGFASLTSLLSSYSFTQLFYQCSIVRANNLKLPATILTEGCYSSLFSGCASLTSAPELPAKRLQSLSYMYMFRNCSSLTVAPVLPATRTARFCYYGMFEGTGLIATPSLSSATMISDGTYPYMFQNCTSLTTITDMPYIGNDSVTVNGTVYGCCQYMFAGCTSLTTVPALGSSVGTYACSHMFDGCTSLATAPELPAKTLANYCYQYMFRNCSSLNYIKCLATDKSATGCTSNWVSGVAASGTFLKASGTTWSSNASGIPSAWATYIALDYIENVSSAYINTGINAANNIGIHIEYEDNYTYGSSSNYIVGARASSSSTILYGIGGSSTNNTTLAYYNGTNANLGVTRTKGKKYVVDLQADSTGLDYSMTVDNGTPITGRITNTLSASSVPICLFGFNSSNIKKNTRMYVCQITQNGTIVRDFEPVQNSSNVAGMLDTANNVFYGSSNSNTFTAASS